MYGGGELADYLIRFVNHLDPNVGPSATNSPVPPVFWPKYTPESRKILTLADGLDPVYIAKDDYRDEGMMLLSELTLEYPI